MKIANIRTADRSNTNQIRSIFGSRSQSVLAEQFGHQINSLPSIFIDTVLESRVLTETDANILTKLFGAGIAKLKAAITPGTSQDLDMLLTFMAPMGGGIEQVKGLLEAAKAAPIHTNEEWWESFYQTFGIDDDLIKQDIRDRVSSEFSQQQRQQQKQKPSVPGGGEVGGGKFDDFLSSLKGVQANRKKTLDAKAAEMQQKEAARAKAQMGGMPESDETMAMVAGLVCEINSVQKNFSLISNLLHHKLGTLCEGKLPPLDDRVLFHVLSEGPMLDKLRTGLGNQNYARSEMDKKNQATAQQYDATAQAADGQRAAKLAVNIAKDHLRQKFNAALQDAGLLPKDIAKSFASWKKLAMIKHKDEKQRAAYQLVSKRLQKAFELFKPAMPNAPEQNPNDPFDPGEPEIVDAEYVGPGPQEGPGGATGEPPHWIGDDEPPQEPQYTEEQTRNREIAALVVKKVQRKMQLAKAAGHDEEYIIRSYLMKLQKTMRLPSNIAQFVYIAWERGLLNKPI